MEIQAEPTGKGSGESAEARLKRMRMRSWRRGTKEMDMVLGPYADAQLQSMDEAGLELFDRLLSEKDQDLMVWIFGMSAPPAWLAGLIGDISEFARNRMAR